jgi:hypothetical protein
MKYYQFIYPLSKKIFGTNGNVALVNHKEYFELMSKDENFHSIQFLSLGLLEGKEDKIFIPKFKEKGPSSKLTNLIWYEGNLSTLIIDNNLKTILCQHNNFGLLFFETSLVYKGGEPLKYWYIVPRNEGSQFIDYSKSQFIEQPDMFDKTTWKYLTFNNSDELTKYEAEKKIILWKDNLTILEKSECDFFALQFVFNRPVGFIVSELLREKIEKEKMTGMQFLEFGAKWP